MSEGGGEERVFEPWSLEAPAAVRPSTPRGREAQRTPRGGARDAQMRGTGVRQARAREVVEDVTATSPASSPWPLRGSSAAVIPRSRVQAVRARTS